MTVALFRFIKYSSLLFLLGKYKHKVFRVVAVLLLAAVTALLYGDVEAYLAREHPDTVVYALLAKIVIVYGALAFVLWQFRPASGLASASPTGKAGRPREQAVDSPHTAAPDRLAQLSDLDRHDRLRRRASDLIDRRH